MATKKPTDDTKSGDRKNGDSDPTQQNRWLAPTEAEAFERELMELALGRYSNSGQNLQSNH